MSQNLSRRSFLKAVGGGAVIVGLPLCTGCSPKANAAVASKPARYWTAGKKGTVTCNLCPHGCVTSPGESGFCRARKNEDGKYVSLVYGEPASINNDPIEKKPFNHVLPGTNALSIGLAGCNLTCKHCQNWQLSQSNPGDLQTRTVTPTQLAQATKKSGAMSLAFTYNEPTTFVEYMIDSAVEVRKLGLGAVIISNGYINEKPQAGLLKHLTAYKVDLKGFSEKFYSDICGGDLKSVEDSLVRIKKSGTWLEIVNLVIPTLNDDEKELEAMSKWIVSNLGADVPVHFTRFHPTYKLRNLPPTPVSTLEKAVEIARSKGIFYAYTGNVPGHKYGSTYCHHCGEMLIKRYAFDVEIKKLKDGKCEKCGTKIPGKWRV